MKSAGLTSASKRRGALFAVITLSILLLTGFLGCTTNQPHSSSDNSGGADTSEVTIIMGTESEPAAGFDPLVNWGTGEHAHEPLIQSTLITTNANMSFSNDLATSYACSADGLQWTFIIRDDVLFTDGEPLTADDVAFTIEGIMTSEASETDLSMVSSVVARDEVTIIITLNKPYNALLYTLAVVGIVPEHAYGESYGSNPVGSGRYVLEQWDKGQQVILVANPDYYGEAPHMQRVVIAFMAEDAALAAARAGQADVVYTSATYSAQHIDGFSLLAVKTVDSRGVSLPTVASGKTITSGDVTYAVGNDVTSNLEIRQAINVATNREAMVAQVLNGYGTIAYSVADGMPWASDDMRVALDQDKAKALLEEAGWVLGADGIYAKGPLRASFDVWYSAGDSVRQALANEFSNQMKDIGIEAVARGGSWDDIYPVAYSSPVLWGWGSNSPSELRALYFSTGGGNFASYTNDTVDAHIDAALAQTNIEDSYDLWQKAQWDGSEGVAPQGSATWVWFAAVDHLYFYAHNLVVAEQKLHPHGHGWSLVNNVDQWYWVS